VNPVAVLLGDDQNHRPDLEFEDDARRHGPEDSRKSGPVRSRPRGHVPSGSATGRSRSRRAASSSGRRARCAWRYSRSGGLEQEHGVLIRPIGAPPTHQRSLPRVRGDPARDWAATPQGAGPAASGTATHTNQGAGYWRCAGQSVSAVSGFSGPATCLPSEAT
jgi:hypothetical protein